MVFRPLRQKRFDYVESIKLDPHTNLPEGLSPDEQAPTHHSILNTLFDKIADLMPGEHDERPKYLVKLQEHDESHLPWYRRQGAVTWIEKATQRDFSIGSSLGAIAGTVLVFSSGGALAVGTIGMMALGGAVIGGVSDYINNTNEIENGAIIEPPEHFNRDAVKSSLKWAGLTKFALVMGAVALNAVGVPTLVPELLSTVAMVAAGIYGAVKGSQEGYERMQQEYVCAVVKNQRPELGVSIKREIGGGVEDLALGAAGLAVATAVAPTVMASSTAAVGMLPQMGANLANGAAQTEQTPNSVSAATLEGHQQRIRQQQEQYRQLEGIPSSEAEGTKTWTDKYPSIASSEGYRSLVSASPQISDGGYQELVANQPRGNFALSASS